MAVITLLTDSGDRDHYVAAIKAKILSLNAGVNIVDISHHVAAFDIAHGAFLLRSVFSDFPRGTVHLVGVNTTGEYRGSFVALELEDHFFVGADNGLFGLISAAPYRNAVNINAINPIESTFPEKTILAPAAAKLASRVAITSLGTPISELRRMTDRHVKATRREIVGRVIHVDSYGNLITNIVQSEFERLRQDNNMVVLLGGERFTRLQTNYNQVEAGDCFLLFNAHELLEIGVNKGRADDLLGLGYDSPIHIRFDTA